MPLYPLKSRHLRSIPPNVTEKDLQRILEGNMSSRNQNVSRLFGAVGVDGFFNFVVNEYSYDVRPDDPESNWLYAAFRGFQRLQERHEQEGKTVETFTSIGSGQSMDAIGAYYLFCPRPRRLVVTDINTGVYFPMGDNLLRHLQDRQHFPPQWKDNEIRTYSLLGNLCEPLREHGIVSDVIYANLPNIPEADASRLQEGKLSASYIDQRKIAAAPQKFQEYHLGLQYTFLKDAHSSLTQGGSILVNLGGRVPLPLVEEMFRECGYDYQDLYITFKEQSEPQEVLTGYSERGEQQYGVEFDFYRFEQAQQLLSGRKADEFSAQQLKELLRPSRVNATEGLELHKKGEKIGHVIQLVRGIKS